MADAPLLSRRRLEDEIQQPSSHNLVDRNRSNSSFGGHGSEFDDAGEEDEEEELPTDYGSGAVYRYPNYLQPGHFTSLEKLFFFTSSILLVVLFIFIGLYARSSQQAPASPLPFPTPKIPKNHTKKQILCLEPNCIITAAQILQDVNTELDPCEDFYSYACSNWKANHVIPDVKSRIDISSMLTESIRRRLNQILNRRRLFPVDTTGLPNPNDILEKQLFAKLSDLYSSCMDQDTIEIKSITPLYPTFQSLREYIPITNSVDKIGLNKAVQYLADRNIWPLFELTVKPDIIQDSTKSILSASRGSIGLTDYENASVMQVYMQVVSSILDITFKKDSNNVFGWKSWSTIATARRIIEFEKRIHEINNNNSKSERWTMQKLQNSLPLIDWHEFIKDLPTPPKYILIENPSYITTLNQLLSDTNPRTLQLYFIWRSIWSAIDVLGEEFAVHKRKLESKLNGIEPRATPERWETCIDLLDKSSMGVLLGRYFITDNHQNIIKSKPIVEDLADKIKHIIQYQMKSQNQILDERSKSQILKKLETLEFQVGYSTSKPDITSVISLSEHFGDITIQKNDFFGNMMKADQHAVKQNVWTKIQDVHVDRNAWTINPQSVDISYSKELNKVIIPGGLLQLPFIDRNSGPNYLYYGTIGWMIGHEIMHGFDTMGRRYNYQGVFGDWWDQETIDILDSQNQCLVSQYNNFGIDGKKTLDNNFADVGGLFIFEKLLKTSSNSTVIIPGLNEWTKDQLAYIQFARMKCSKSTKEQQKLIKNCSPDRYRVNGPLINSNQFSATFGCKLGSPMNPTRDKCQIWAA